ncbi:hypothetical protein SH1V18_16630 [Vallitalea longa]|uniref:Lipoprotein n=1 Tax=Vallitalea longa TaxID=2936439 RepID=A0A9W5YB79_9FIRM|nr:hypothetical protein [Vallitalea longa]GKX29183.1 hypothetical protein SH1V18_16630 [Vallitalea longa]
MKKLFIIITIIVLLTGCTNSMEEKYNDLNTKYNELKEEKELMLEELQTKESDVQITDQENIAMDILEKQTASEIVFTWSNEGAPFGESIEYFNEWLQELQQKHEYFNDGFSLDVLSDSEVEMLNIFKHLCEKEYSVYANNELLGKTNGKLSIGEYDGYEGVEAIMTYDNPNLHGLFVTGDYNHIPTKVNTILDTTSENDKNHIVPESSERVEKYKEVGKNIVPSNMEVNITQIFEGDLDADGKIERIVNYSNAPKDSDDIAGNWNNIDFTKYYTIIVALDENYQLIDYVHNIINIEDNMVYSNLFTTIDYFLDMDNNGEMEIISIKPSWESAYLYVDKILKYERRVQGKIYFF